MSAKAPRKKSAKGNPARQKSPSAPSHSPDTASASRLWADFAATARKLYDHSVSAPETVDFLQQHSAIQWLFAMLRKNSKVGGSKAEEAVRTLHWLARFGTVFLLEASKDEKSRETLKVLAATHPDWPVLLSPQKSSHETAKTYLYEIGVGTRSTPPTAKTRISADDPWTELAIMLTYKIRSVQTLLRYQARKESHEKEHPEAKGKAPILPTNPLFPELETDASKWKRVLDLPLELNKNTQGKWWAVAKEILKDYLKANSHEAKLHYKRVKTTADDEAKSPETIVIKSVREAFYAIVTAAGSPTMGVTSTVAASPGA